MKETKLTYLAIPYTWNPNKSFDIANKMASILMQGGKAVFSPISHAHPIADHMGEELRTSQEFWMKQDSLILSRCDEMIVVVINNDMSLIENSKGVQEELSIAKELNIPVKYIYYNG